MAGVFLPAGYSMTFTAGTAKAGDYTLVGSADSYTVVSAGATATIGPFNAPRQYEVNGLTNSQSPSGVYTGVDDANLDLKAPLADPTFTGTVALPVATIAKANATEAANAVTASASAGVITTSALTTEAGSSYAITWTNTKIATTSVIQLTLAGGTNTKMVAFKVVAGSGTATLTIYNLDLLAALDGTVKINYLVV